MGNEPLLAQTCYICNYMRNLIHATAWKYVAATCNINNYLTKFPPNYESGQKLSAAALLGPLSAHLPKRSRTLLTEHSYNPGNGTIGRFINLCEHAEAAESIEFDKIYRWIIEDDNFDSFSNGSNRRSRKKYQKKSKRTAKRESSRKGELYCD